MRKSLYIITHVFPSEKIVHLSLLVFRIAISVELMAVHGLKKIGIGVEAAEQVPNPFGLPGEINQALAIASNLVFPVLVIFGLLTRLAILPVLAVTLSGYFVIHWHDSLWEKDMPFMYSIAFLLLGVLGPGKYSMDDLIHKKLYR